MKVFDSKILWLVITVVVLAAYWLLPIQGTLIFIPGDELLEVWPRFDVDAVTSSGSSEISISVTDTQPWSYVTLTVDNVTADPIGAPTQAGHTWTWRWTSKTPDSPHYEIAFYTNCHTGCESRGEMTVGSPLRIEEDKLPTKLGVVLPNLERDWHGRRGWAVEIAYATQLEEPYWGVDDLASRVASHATKGLNTLIRVDYDPGQSVPPTGDYVALSEYLAFFSRLARDDRLATVYGYIVGNEYNTQDAVSLYPDKPITPEWYARIFNGYGENPYHTDNVLQTIRQENPHVRVIVGPVRPWSTEFDEEVSKEHETSMPWLSYMQILVSHINTACLEKSKAGVSASCPDGFDIQAPGMPDILEMAGYGRYEEPAIDLQRESWNNARIGFSVYKDWLGIINAFPSTRGLPVYIISTNTYHREANIPPAQNYPQGWLTTALTVINAEPQIHALCWFLDDFPHSDQWDWFSLTQQSGRLVDAAEEFDALLQFP